MLQSPVLTIRRDENDFSHSQVVIGKVPNSFKATCIFGKASEPTLFSITETEAGKLFLNFTQFPSLCQRSNSSIIRQMGKSQNGLFKKTKQAKFSEKRTFLAPSPDTHTYVCVSGGKKCSFFGKFGLLCFLETPDWNLESPHNNN